MTRIALIGEGGDAQLSLGSLLRSMSYDVRCADNALTIGAPCMSDADLVILNSCPCDSTPRAIVSILRAASGTQPIIILASWAGYPMLSDTFLAGDDQYFVEPFDPVTLTSRVASITDSAHPGSSARGSTMSFGDITIDFDTCTVTKRGARVRLSPKEYDLLLTLIQRRGTILPREALLRDVWGYGPGIVTRTVDAHIAELRRKLETVPSEPRHLLTVRKRGYRFVV